MGIDSNVAGINTNGDILVAKLVVRSSWPAPPQDGEGEDNGEGDRALRMGERRWLI